MSSSHFYTHVYGTLSVSLQALIFLKSNIIGTFNVFLKDTDINFSQGHQFSGMDACY